MQVAEVPLLLSAKQAAAAIGVGKSFFYCLHSSGRLGPLPVHLGRRTLWNRQELESWVQQGCPARDKWQELKKQRPDNAQTNG